MWHNKATSIEIFTDPFFRTILTTRCTKSDASAWHCARARNSNLAQSCTTRHGHVKKLQHLGPHIYQKVSLQFGYVFRTHTTITWCWHNIWVGTYIYFIILGCITNSYKHNKCLTVIVLTILNSIDSFSLMKYHKIDYPSALSDQGDHTKAHGVSRKRT